MGCLFSYAIYMSHIFCVLHILVNKSCSCCPLTMCISRCEYVNVGCWCQCAIYVRLMFLCITYYGERILLLFSIYNVRLTMRVYKCGVLMSVCHIYVSYIFLCYILWWTNAATVLHLQCAARDSDYVVATMNRLLKQFRSLLQNIVSFVGLFCRRDLLFWGAY